MYYVIFAVSISFNAAANLLLRYGMKEVVFSEITFKALWENVILNIWVWAGILSFGIAFLAFSYVVANKEQGELSFAYPINTSLGFLIIVLVSWLFMGDHMSVQRLAGIGLITLGVWLVAGTGIENQ